MGKLAEALSIRQQAHQRHQDLLRFRSEYTRDILSTARQGIAATRLQGLQKFLENLDKAIEEQVGIVAHQNVLVQNLTLEWQLHRQSLNGVQNWMEEVQQAERKQEEVKEQKELDELSLRAQSRTSR